MDLHKMIWTLRIECVWGWHFEKECIRIIEIDSESSLYDLHSAIQDAVGFDKDHLFEFTAGRNERNRKIEFGTTDDWKDGFDSYHGIKLSQVYPLPKSCKLYYHFDFGDDWYFAITRSRKKPTEPVTNVTYPRVIEAIGLNPAQYGSYEEE